MWLRVAVWVNPKQDLRGASVSAVAELLSKPSNILDLVKESETISLNHQGIFLLSSRQGGKQICYLGAKHSGSQ